MISRLKISVGNISHRYRGLDKEAHHLVLLHADGLQLPQAAGQERLFKEIQKVSLGVNRLL